MKIYENAVTSIPIKGCKECPNRAKISHSSYSFNICKVLTRYEKNPSFGEMEIPIWTNINEYVRDGGYHPYCPLSDLKSGERS